MGKIKIIIYIFLIILFFYIGFNLGQKCKIDKNTININDTIYNTTTLDSIQYNITKKDSVIYKLKESMNDEIKEANNLNDSSSVKLFKSLVTEQ